MQYMMRCLFLSTDPRNLLRSADLLALALVVAGILFFVVGIVLDTEASDLESKGNEETTKVAKTPESSTGTSDVPVEEGNKPDVAQKTTGDSGGSAPLCRLVGTVLVCVGLALNLGIMCVPKNKRQVTKDSRGL